VNWDSTIFIAGGQTLLGSALVRRLRRQGYCRVLGDGRQTPDLTCRESVHEYFADNRPQLVFHAAGRAGGILANQSQPAELCHNNLLVTLNILEAAHRFGVQRLLYVASACCYPRLAPQPLQVESLWSGPLESTNEAYAAAKLAGIALCRAYRQQHGCDFLVGIAANAFGPGDDFDPRQAHVIGSLMARMHEARMAGEPSFTVWGTGKPVREFLYIDDLADACLHVMRHARDVELINLAGGTSLSISELAECIRNVVGYRGRLVFDTSRPDGMPLKSLDGQPLAALGWQPKIDFDEGLTATYEWFLEHTSRLAHAG
jgi:GDP-L-fucose synthase